MTPDALLARFHTLYKTQLHRPGAGSTAERHKAIFAAGREDLTLAKLIEAHWDAIAILEEAGIQPAADKTYAVWASEIPGKQLVLENGTLSGSKEFCSGAAIVDRALVTAGSSLVEIDLHLSQDRVSLDESGWHTNAFRMTRTAALTFEACPIVDCVGEGNWYTQRTGFWQGACGPAAAWAGGAAGLVDYALHIKRDDPHALAHVAAMHSAVSAMETLVLAAGDALDRAPNAKAMVEALALRHVIEQMCSDVLRRFSRALGPAPFVKDADISRRYAELDLFLRQSHGERDLETLGRALREVYPFPAY